MSTHIWTSILILLGGHILVCIMVLYSLTVTNQCMRAPYCMHAHYDLGSWNLQAGGTITISHSVDSLSPFVLITLALTRASPGARVGNVIHDETREGFPITVKWIWLLHIANHNHIRHKNNATLKIFSKEENYKIETPSRNSYMGLWKDHYKYSLVVNTL